MKKRKRDDTLGIQMKLKEWTINIRPTKAQVTEEADTEVKEMGMDMEISTGTIKGGDEKKERGGRKMGKLKGKCKISKIN